MLETAAALIALLAAHLVTGRFRRSASLSDLVLACALFLLGLSNLVFAALPAALASGQAPVISSWAAMMAALVGAGVFVLAAFLPGRRVAHPGSMLTLSIVGSVVFLLALVVAVADYADRLPAGVAPDRSPEHASGAQLVASPIFVIQLFAAALFAVAALGFVRRAEQQQDSLMRSLGIAAVLASFSRFNYFLYPSLFSQWVYTGDIFRLLFYLVLLGSALQEISRYWTAVRGAAVVEERRRIARELHDGLAQELAFIATRAKALPTASRPERVRMLAHVGSAAERALEEARRAIAVLVEPLDQAFDVSLVQTVEEMVGRVGAQAELDVARGVELPPRTRETLLRIVREAVTNANRHGRAKTISVQLSNHDGLRLLIADDGDGFDVTEPERLQRGFGLLTMRERVQALSGELRIESRPGVGTEVEVILP
jgi:signal transduction histidine kinase